MADESDIEHHDFKPWIIRIAMSVAWIPVTIYFALKEGERQVSIVATIGFVLVLSTAIALALYPEYRFAIFNTAWIVNFALFWIGYLIFEETTEG